MSQARLLGIGAVALLMMFSGCAGVLAHQNMPEEHQTPQASPDQPHCATWVSFYALEDPDTNLWTRDQVSIGYTLPGDVSVFFVVSENGTILGHEHETTENIDSGLTADGDAIELYKPLNGVHNITVTTYVDVNNNGQFEPDTDKPCENNNGNIVRTSPEPVNFSRFDMGDESGTPSPSTPRPDETPTLTPTPNE